MTHTPGSPPRKAFTLIELLIAVGIIAMLMAMLAPSLHMARLHAMRTTCRGNIHGIAVACVSYATSLTTNRGTTASALPNTAPTSANWANIVTGNPAGLWLLVITDFATPRMFYCPEAGMRRKYRPGRPEDPSFLYEDGVSTLSYSYISMLGTYTATGAGALPPRPFRDATIVASTEFSSELVIVADQNPRTTFNSDTLGPDEGKNSLNHNRAGQNIGALDQTARWITSCETEAEDDIYASDTASKDAQKTRSDLNDSFLLP